MTRRSVAAHRRGMQRQFGRTAIAAFGEGQTSHREENPQCQRTKPPFRADHVGSLLRPAALKEAREQCAKGEINAAALKAVEDREIERVIKKQEEVGLQSITDGEFRRSWWHLDFLWGLDGVEST